MGDFQGNTLCIRFALRDLDNTKISSEVVLNVEEKPFPPPYTQVIRWISHYLDSVYPQRQLEELLIAKVTENCIYPTIKLPSELQFPDLTTPKIPLYLRKQNKVCYRFKLEHIFQQSSSATLESRKIEIIHEKPQESRRFLYEAAEHIDQFMKDSGDTHNFSIEKFHLSTSRRNLF